MLTLLRDVNMAPAPAILAYLKDTASSEAPANQTLLRAARDCLPHITSPSAEPSWYEQQYHKYLDEAQQVLTKK